MKNQVIHGNCLKVMKKMPDNCISTIITDPPYGLSFMGKDWDKVVPAIKYWKAALRVAKHGCMMLVFGGTRTFHRLTCNIEDAGWEIRDCMMWLYGSGFPKSLNVARQVDKLQGGERKVTKEKRSGKSSRAYQSEETTTKGIHYETKGTSEWEGYGTALKPAWEPIIVCMKPIEGTFAQNAIKHGVAGLNIDGGRIEAEEGVLCHRSILKDTNIFVGFKEEYDGKGRQYQNKGRWPANVILDEDAGKLLDEQSGVIKGQKSGGTKKRVSKNSEEYWGKGGGGFRQGRSTVFHTGSGGASRFFYCAKTSKRERNLGMPEGQVNNHPTVKPLALLDYLCKLTMTPSRGIVMDMFAGSGSLAVAAAKNGIPFLLIEKDSDSFKLAEAKVKYALTQYTEDINTNWYDPDALRKKFLELESMDE